VVEFVVEFAELSALATAKIGMPRPHGRASPAVEPGVFAIFLELARPRLLWLMGY
jgi:hypothetical protein